jgi:hypothetical protein
LTFTAVTGEGVVISLNILSNRPMNGQIWPSG